MIMLLINASLFRCCLRLKALSLILLPLPVHAQGWVTSLTPYDQNGTPVSGADSNGDPCRQQLIDGVLTG